MGQNVKFFVLDDVKRFSDDGVEYVLFSKDKEYGGIFENGDSTVYCSAANKPGGYSVPLSKIESLKTVNRPRKMMK